MGIQACTPIVHVPAPWHTTKVIVPAVSIQRNMACTNITTYVHVQ